ncbi:HEAT repeat domain-containing protein [Magnetococcales bacterium HHB-1]
MGLIKPKKPTNLQESKPDERRRSTLRGPGGLLEQLTDPRPLARRWAVRDLSAFPEAVNALLAHLHSETDDSVREVILTSLLAIGGETVVIGLMPYLRSEDTFLRNGAIETLQGLPSAVSGHIEALLRDQDPDVRIFAVDILRELAHPEAPLWLEAVLDTEPEVNVCASVVDCLAEVGNLGSIPAIQSTLERFPEQPFLKFAADMAIKRIRNED